MLILLADTAGVDNLAGAVVRMAVKLSMKSAKHIKARNQNDIGDPLNGFTTKNTAIVDNNKANE
jgi:hypothetical protein